MAGIQVEVIVTPGSDGNKYATAGQKISEFYKSHPDYKHLELKVFEGHPVQGNVICFIVYEVS